MHVIHPTTPSTSVQANALIEELKKITAAKAKTTNELCQMLPSQNFSTVFGSTNTSELLRVFVERSDTTFNVYWQQIDEAAEYSVEVYKYASMRWYKLTEISVDRNEGYVAISNLVGDGYVFRVKAMNRAGEELAKSAGTIIGSKIAE